MERDFVPWFLRFNDIKSATKPSGAETMKRRDFIVRTLAVAGAATNNLTFSAPQNSRFQLKYAPGIGQFKAHAGDDPVSQIQFAADQGFTAMFDNGIMNRPPEQQDRIVRELTRLNLTLGPFVLFADFTKKSFVNRDKETRDMLLRKMREGVETMKRTGAPQALVAPGRSDESLAWDYQTANVVENLRFCMEIAQPAGMIVVLEPLNPKNHPGQFLTRIPQAYSICRAVNNPSCKILDDMYHQQVTEGNLIPNIDAAWEEIAAFHIGDNPGRNEPTTGEINYRNVFKWLHARGYSGVLCMEHGQSKPGKEGERAVLEAYRACDQF
jgi:hydroxypyruvate isomerase